MKRFFLFLLTMCFLAPSSSIWAQDARGYYRKFGSETRRIQIKNMRYLEAMVRGDNPRITAKFREMVLEQLKDSHQSLSFAGAYQDDDVLQREYLRALDSLIEAYDVRFAKAEAMTDTRYDSKDSLDAYIQLVESAELQAIDAFYRIEKAEDYFGKTYNVDLRRDEEMLKKAENLDGVTLYTRDLTSKFYTVDAKLRNLFHAAQNDQADSAREMLNALSVELNKIVMDLDNNPEPQGFPRYLHREVIDYCETIYGSIEEEFRPLLAQLDNKFLDQKEYQNAQENLQDILEYQDKRLEDFQEAKNKLISDILEED